MKRLLYHTLMGLALAGLGLAAGCAGMPSQPAGAPGQAYRPGDFLAPPDPKPLSQAELERRLAQARVVLVGERHDHPGHHQIQLAVLKSLAKSGPVVVGVEWLEQSAQPACDRLSAGKISVDQFRGEVDWDRTWNHSWEMFRPIFAEVRDKGHTLVALNAPLSIVRQVAKGGLKSLSPAQRAAIAQALDLDDPTYKAQVARQFAFHGVKSPAAQENFFAAQVVRDETMARNLAQRLYPWPDSSKQALVLAGRGHVAGNRGLPPRIARRLPGVKLLEVIPLSPGAAQAMATAGGLPQGGLLAVSTPAPRARPLLGVLLKLKDGRLLVKRVIPGSPAAKAGVQPGDVLLAVDGRPLTSPKGIHDAIKAGPYRPHQYRLQRGERELTLEIALPRPSAPPRKP